MQNKSRILKICRVGLFAALLALGAWIAIPFPVPITLQTFVLFLVAGTLPLVQALSSVAVYLGIGLVGLPVFAGFGAGIGTFLGPTGGFLLGFLPAVLLFSLSCDKKQSFLWQAMSACVSLILIYSCGAVWYTLVYGGKGVIGACILPFFPADAIKIAIALPLARRLKRHIR